MIKNKNNFEKLYEELFNLDEVDYLFDQHGFFIIKDIVNKKSKQNKKKLLLSRISNFNFQKPEEIIPLLKKTGIVF